MLASFAVGSGPGGGNRNCCCEGFFIVLWSPIMPQTQMASSIAACHACALACDRCADACLHEANVNAMAECIALDIDCADICRVAAAYMGRNSPLAAAVCDTCAEVCEHCQEICGRYQMDHCKACAEACRVCATECRAMAANVASPSHRSPDEVVAGLRQ